MTKYALPFTLLSIIILASTALFFYNKKRHHVHDDSYLTVGTSAEFPPFEYIEHDTLTGFDIDLVNELAKRMGKKLIIKDMPFSTLITQLNFGSLHMIAAGLTPTSERAQQVLFSQNYTAGEPLVIVTRAIHAPLKTLADLANQDVIVNDGFSAEAYLSSQYPNIALKRLPTVADAFLALNSGRADAFVTAVTTVKPFFDQYGSENFITTAIPGTSEPAAFAISKKYPELVERINATLQEMQEDGSLETLKRKWHLS